MIFRVGLVVVVPLAVMLAVAPVSRPASVTPLVRHLVAGKELYRQYCEECHVLFPDNLAGFGTDSSPGPWGGPAFGDVYVP